MKDVKAITIPECVVANTAQTFSSTSNTSGSYTYFNYYRTNTENLGSCISLRIKGKYYFNSGTYSWSGLWYFDRNGSEVQITPTIGASTEFDITCYLNKDTWMSGKWNVFVIAGQIDSNYRHIRVVVDKTNNRNLDFYTQSNSTSEICNVEIDSVEVGVSKIEDSNGNIIWGSEDVYPYRQLECLNMYGTYISLPFKPLSSMYYAQCGFPSSFNSAWGMIYGAEGYSASAAQRFWFAMNSSNGGQLFYRFKAIEVGISSQKLANLNPSSIYECRLKNYFSGNNTSGRYWVALVDVTNGASNQLFGSYYNATSLSMDFNTFNNMGINIANRRNANGFYSAQAGNANFSLYGFYIKVQDTGGYPKVFNGIPVQRKLDSVCGLYDVVNSVFYPCSGSASITCGGSIITEYFEPSSIIQ